MSSAKGDPIWTDEGEIAGKFDDGTEGVVDGDSNTTDEDGTAAGVTEDGDGTAAGVTGEGATGDGTVVELIATGEGDVEFIFK